MKIEPQTPLLIQHLRTHPINVALHNQDAKERQLRVGDPHRRGLWGQSIQTLMTADRYIYDSGNDSREVSRGVTDTALALIERDRFHLPRPVCIVEDYFHATPSARHIHICRELPDCITVESFCSVPDLGEIEQADFDAMTMEQWGDMVAQPCPVDFFVWNPILLIIPLASHPQYQGSMSWGGWANGQLWYDKQDAVSEKCEGYFGKRVYSVKKFLVMLSTTGIVVEERRPKPILYGQREDRKYRNRPFSYVRVPFTFEVNEDGTRKRHAPSADSDAGEKTPRKAHWVRGHVWGRHVRPIEQQRWYAPYFRGLGIPDANPKTTLISRKAQDAN